MTIASPNTLIHLTGPPGVGKYTIGKILAERTGYRLVDNHHWLNPILSLMDHDGVSPLPGSFWAQTDRTRGAVMSVIADLSPRHWGFIFTQAPSVPPDARDYAIYGDIARVARQRGGRHILVRLRCDALPLADRLSQPDRRLRLKETDPGQASIYAVQPLFDPGHEDPMDIDSTALSADDVAREILRRIR